MSSLGLCDYGHTYVLQVGTSSVSVESHTGAHSGSRSAFLLGAALFVCGGILLAGLLLWLTRRVLRVLRAG